jgi:hypothetical protein
MGFEWSRSLTEILGASWQPLVEIIPERLAGFGAEPRVRKLGDTGDGGFDYVEWFDPGGVKLADESGSPAVLHSRRASEVQGATAADIAKSVSEMLALPGRRADYHFGMLSAWDSLFAARRTDHRVFGWIERLCLADIAMLEQGPQLTFSENHWVEGEERTYPVFPGYTRLSSIYQREGFLSAAVDLERRAAALGVVHPAGENALARQTALLEEDGR